MLNNSWNYGGILNQDGVLLIGVTGGNPTASFLTSSAGTLAYTFSPGAINIEVNPNSTFLDPLVVRNGGTGQVILTVSGVLIGEGSNGVNVTAAGTDGQLLIAAAGADPQFSTITSSGGTLTFFFGHNSIDMAANFSLLSFFNPLAVRSGGTGLVLFTSYGVLIGEGSNNVNVAAGTNGQVLIASSTGDPAFVRLTTHAMLTFAFGYNTLNIEANVTSNTFFRPLAVLYGGTSRTILTRFGVLLGEGSNQVNVTAAGTQGQVLIASTTGDPKFGRITSTGGSITFTVGYNSLNIDVVLYSKSFFNPLQVASGGSGRTILTTYGVLLGEGSNRIGAAVGTNGQLLIASSTGNPAFASVTSTGKSLTFTFGYNSLNIEPTFALSSAVNPLPVIRGATGRTILTTYGVLIGEGSNNVGVTAAGTNGQILIASSTGDPQFVGVTSTGGSITFTMGYNSLNFDISYATNMFFNPLPVSNGGTGQTILTSYGILVGEGSNNVGVIAAGTNGQVLIASSTGNPLFMTITSTGGSVTFTVGYNSLNMNISFSSAAFFNPLPEVNGGTGQTILTSYGVIVGQGSNGVHVTAAGTNGQLLIASSTGDPKFFTVTSNAATLTFTIFTSSYNSLNIDTTPLAGIPYPILAVNGATGRTVLTAYGVLIGEGSNSIDVTAGTNGQVLIASSTGDPQFGAISSTGGSVTLIGGYNSLNIEADFSMGPLSPVNGGSGNTIFTLYGVLIGEGSNALNATSGTNGQVLIASSTGDPLFMTITSSGGSITFVFGYNSLNMEFVVAAALIPVSGGGTGRTILTTYGVLVGEGSNQINVTAAGTNGQVLIASSTGDPAFATISSSGGSMTFVFGYNSLNIEYVPLSRVITVPNQGTGETLLTSYGVLIGEGSNNVNVTAAGTSGQVLVASSTGDPAFATITSTGGTINFTAGYNSLNIEINPLAVVRPTTNGGTGETILTTYGVLLGEGSNNVNMTDPGTNGQVLVAASTGDPAFATISSTGGSFAFSYGYNSLNIDISAPLNMNFGGTGNTILTTFGVLIGEGSNGINVTAAGTNGQVLIASTTGDPKFARITSSSGTITFIFGYNSLNMEVVPGNQMHLVRAGGTGRTLLTAFGVLLGEGSNNVNVTAAGTNGQLLIASSTGDPKFVRVTSTGGTMTFGFGPNSFNIEVIVTSQVDGVAGGGTGRTILTTFGVLIGEGSNQVNSTAPGTSGQVLIASSTGDPKFVRITSTGGSLSFRVGINSLNVDINGTADISFGGTKRAILTTYGVLIGEGSRAVNVTAAGTNGQVLIASSTGDPQFASITSNGGTITFTAGYNSLNLEIVIGSQSTPVAGGGTGQVIFPAYGALIGEGSNPVDVVVGTNGQVLIASSTGDPKFVRITSTGNTLTFNFGYNSLNVDVNGILDTSIGALKRSILTAYGVLIGEGSKAINMAVGTSGQLLIASSTGDPKFATITSSGGSIAFSVGYNRLNIDINPGSKFYPVSSGGTGRTILTSYGVLLGEGSNNVNVTAAGTNGQVLIASSTGDPKFTTITSSGGSIAFSVGYNRLNIDINPGFNFYPVSSGGTGRTILTSYGVLLGEGSNNVNVTAAGTNGQVLIAATGADPKFATITSSGNTITFVSGRRSLNIDTTANYTYLNPWPVGNGGTFRTLLTLSGVLLGEGSNNVNVTAAGTNGQLLIGSTGADPLFATITSSGGSLSFTVGAGSLNMDIAGVVGVNFGGTNCTILTTFGVLLGEGSNGIHATAAGTSGQLLLAASSADPAFSTLTSTGNTFVITSGVNSLNIDLALPIQVGKRGTGNTVLTTFGVLLGEGSNSIHATAAGTNGQLLIARTNADPAFSTITSSRGTITFTNGANSLNVELGITFTRANTPYLVNTVMGITSSALTASISTSFNYYLIDTTNGTVTLQFPASPLTGKSWIIKDRGGMSDLNPIRITTAAGTLNFDGQTFFNLTNPFGAVQIMYNGNAPAHYEII